MFEVLIGGMVGVASGMRHAMEPDHLAAVSTFAVGGRKPTSAMRFAAAWGAGHALMLLLVSGTLVLTRRELPFAVGQAFEVGVAVMLVALGVRAIAQRADLIPHAHEGGVVHVGHHHPTDATADEGLATLARPLLVGVVHGLAGSGALSALTMATVGSPAAGIAYVALYGFGAMLGMALLAGIAGAPLARLAQSKLAMRSLTVATGLVSVAVGLAWGAEAARHLVG